MRNLLMRFSLVLLSLILLPSFASGQRGGAGFGGRGRPPATPSTEPFDPHDFNGIWWRTGGTREFNTQDGTAIQQATGKETPWSLIPMVSTTGNGSIISVILTAIRCGFRSAIGARIMITSRWWSP